jgi:hypothetical protein
MRSAGFVLMAVLVLTTVREPPAAAQAPSGHPRLWITQADLPRLRSWATDANPLWKRALYPALQAAIQTYDTRFFPGGVPAVPYPDRGTRDYELYCSEAYAEFFAFLSLVDNDAARRDANALRARNLLMHVMNEAAKGCAIDSGGVETPFRGTYFSSYNRFNYWGEAFGLTVDWMYPYLSAEDKSIIRGVFLRWSEEQLGAYPMMRYFPSLRLPPNDPRMLGVNETEQMQLRWVANNYYAGHARNMTLWSLAFDAADDPPLDPSKPVDSLGNTLRSWLRNITGGWLYQQYALYEDSAVVARDYGVSTGNITIGKASGGIPVEGTLYGFSVGMVMQELLALYTAGLADSTRIGPQMKLLTSSLWDGHVDGFLHSITPTSRMPYDPRDRYMGEVYEPACFGDVLRYWITFQSIENFGPVALYDMATGNAARLAKLRWICRDALEGGATKFLDRASSVWSDVHVTLAILYFLMYDPAAPADPDPRPALPTDFYQASIGRVLSRTDWSADARWFTFLNPWESINHINETAGQFEFYRKGEWLAKQWSGYGNISMLSPEFFNTISVKNDRPSYLLAFEDMTDSLGGQWTNGMSAGDPTTRCSFAKDYTYVEGNMTNLYNSRDARDVRNVSRSIVWVKPDHLVIYDRAATGKFGRFKRVHCTLLEYPSIHDRTATITTAKGQKFHISNLLPSTATMREQHFWTTDPSKEYNAVAWNEPSKYRIVIEDTAADTRFLNVMQGADASDPVTPAAAFASPDGRAEGCVLGSMAIVFPRHENFGTHVSYRVPATVTGHVVTGMLPREPYAVTTTRTGDSIDVGIRIDGHSVADSAGVLAFGTTVISTQAERAGDRDAQAPSHPGVLSISPHPVHGEALITLSGQRGPVRLKVYNTLGRLVQAFVLPQAGSRVNLSALAPGLYVAVAMKDGRAVTTRFVVR